jgi:peptide/nickel transport system permease protein
MALLPQFAPFDPGATAPEIQLQKPGFTHWLGTDLLGRDIFSRLLHGGRRTLGISVLATGLAVALGSVLAIASRWFRSCDPLITACLDALLAIPGLMLALLIITVLGQSQASLIIAVGLAQVAPFAHVIRAGFVQQESAEYIVAAIGQGGHRFHILREHILPGLLPVGLSYAGVIFGFTILNSAALSFIGMTGDSAQPDWGVMLAEYRAIFRIAPWASIAPGLLLTLLIWMVNRAADELSGANYRRGNRSMG